MAFSRTAILRTGARALQGAKSPLTIGRSQLCRQIGRRGYASEGGHHAKKSGSDLPWLIGSVVVTAPIAAWLLQQTPAKETGHGHGHDEHGEEHEEHEEGGDEEKADADGDEEKSDDSDDSESKDESAEGGDDQADSSDSDDEAQDTPDTSDDEGSSGAQFKGPTKGGPAPDERERIPDAKGGFKRRINSKLAKSYGATDEPEGDGESEPLDKAAGSKSPSSKNHTSGKQEGISNTDTKHSTDLGENNEKSKKPEGTVDTGKVKGTVDSNRPAA